MKLKLILFFTIFVVAQARFVQRLVGGYNVEPKSFPNVAALKGYKIYPEFLALFCSGTIINEWWILATAKCVSKIGPMYPKEHVTVEVGKWRLNGWEPVSQWRNISGAYTHDRYYLSIISGAIEPFDLGIIKLALALVFNSYVHAFPISMNSTYPTGSVEMVGWGCPTLAAVETDTPADILQVLNMVVIDRQECIDAIQTIVDDRGLMFFPVSLNEYIFCTGSSTSLRGSASGDSGGPVMQKNELGEYEVVGVISAGVGPLGLPGPGLHTHVPPLIGWITSVMSQYATAQA